MARQADSANAKKPLNLSEQRLFLQTGGESGIGKEVPENCKLLYIPAAIHMQDCGSR
jgi:hypothetical protein